MFRPLLLSKILIHEVNSKNNKSVMKYADYLGIGFVCSCCSCGWWWIRTTCLRKEIRRLFPIRQCTRTIRIRIRLQPRKSCSQSQPIRTVKGPPFPPQGNYLTCNSFWLYFWNSNFCLRRSIGLITVNIIGNTITLTTFPLTPSLPRLTNKPRPRF